jgi:hypothetical protein
MTHLPRLLSMLGAATLLAALPACSSNGDDDGGSCTGAKCDDLDKPDSEIPDSPCDGVMVDESGRANQKVAGRLHDPLAELVFKSGEDCPATFQDIVAKLKARDTENCDPAEDGAGMITRAISETAQLADAPTSYRLVTSRSCGNREDHEIMFSSFGIRAGAASLPQNVEMIAFDSTAGVFNYYETDGTRLHFFGNSKDFIGKGPGQGDERRCAGCHTGGGLIMKELEAPWLHWEGDTATPGVAELIEAHRGLLGQQSDGIELEGTVVRANSLWNATRLEFLKQAGDTRKILEPLFCDTEINLLSSGPGEFSFLPSDFLLGSQVTNFPFLSFDNALYKEALARAGSTVPGTGKADTFFPFAFAKKALADDDYVRQLIDAGIVDDDLIKDVMMVDFTRPVFSEDRCGLLQLVPGIPVEELTADRLRTELLAAVAGAPADSPADELRKNLETTDPLDAHVTNFTSFCEDRLTRDQAGLLDDVLKVASLNRDRARKLQIMEFPETMPDDTLQVAEGTRLHPESCTLTTEFVGTTGKAVGRMLPEGGRLPPGAGVLK